MRNRFIGIVLSLFVLATVVSTLMVSVSAQTVNMTVSGQLEDGTEEVINTYESFVEGWDYAMDLASDGKKMKEKDYTYIVVDIHNDWNAVDGEFDSSWFNGPGFNWDTIYVPDDAKVILNLNGKTINRGLTEWEYNGEVMYIDEDAQVIINGGSGPDDPTEGTICGGFSCNGAGGIHINDDAHVTLNNVRVTRNIVDCDDGGGIALYDGATLIMNGGEVSNNTATLSIFLPVYGIGIYSYKSTVVLNDVDIYGNGLMPYPDTDVEVEGVALNTFGGKMTLNNCNIYDNGTSMISDSIIRLDFNTEFTMTNTKIYNNGFYLDESAHRPYMGVGCLFYMEEDTKITITDTEIYGNRTRRPIFYYFSASDFTATGLNVHDNISTLVECFGSNNFKMSFTECSFNANGASPNTFALPEKGDITFVDCNMGDSVVNDPSRATFVRCGDEYRRYSGSMISSESMPSIANVASLTSLCISVGVMIYLIADKKRSSRNNLMSK